MELYLVKMNCYRLMVVILMLMVIRRLVMCCSCGICIVRMMIRGRVVVEKRLLSECEFDLGL